MDNYLRQSARRRPTHPALIDAGSGATWSYEELDEWADQIASGLADQGVELGDRIGLVMSRRPEAIATLWGVFRIGGTLVPLDPAEPASALRSRVERAEVKLTITGPETEEFEREARSDTIPTVEFAGLTTASGNGPNQAAAHPRPVPRRKLDDTRVVLFTSGTTGTPTGVCLTGRNLGASAASTVERLGATAADRWLLDLPIYHAGGFSIPLRTAMLGATTVLRRSFDAAQTAGTIAEYDVTGLSLVPTMVERLLDGPGLSNSLRFVLVGGAPTPPELTRRALEAGVPLYTSYGMTETASGIATATPADLRSNPETVGRPVLAASISIRGDSDRPLPAGQTGEIAVSGPIVSPGTVDGTERRPGEPLRTGDRGYLTDDGLLVVTGRVDDLILTGGENVSPREVEAAIRALDSVVDVSVLGLPDEEWGQRVGAAIVLDETGTPADLTLVELREQLRGDLADYKLPKTVAVLDSLPRTASGTVDREALRRRLESDTADRPR